MRKLSLEKELDIMAGIKSASRSSFAALPPTARMKQLLKEGRSAVETAISGKAGSQKSSERGSKK